jgi:manganese transport protein
MLLAYVILAPLLPESWRQAGRPPVTTPAAVLAKPIATPSYRRILVPLDHSGRDRDAVAHSAALARAHGARLYLVHVEEGVTSQVYGPEAQTAEVTTGSRYFDEIVDALRLEGIDAECVIRHSPNPSEEILRVAQKVNPDLIVMGAHGHKWWKDIVFGTTINAVRHASLVPVLIVRDKAAE